MHDWLQIGVDYHGAGALVFAEFRQEKVRQRKRQAEFIKYAANRALVLRIGEGKQCGDGNRFSAAGVHIARQHSEIFGGGFVQNLAARADALRDAETQTALAPAAALS